MANLIFFHTSNKHKSNTNYKTLIKNEKWFKNLTSGDIKVKHQVYELSATENKRRFIYKNNKRIDTKPLVINSDKEVI